MLERLKLQIKESNVEKIKNTTVLIIGLGGVGSYALESIVRSGIGKIIIVDKDVVDITNLNRQLMTLHSNIGQNKTDVWENRIKDINPDCKVKKITQFITEENINILFEDKDITIKWMGFDTKLSSHAFCPFHFHQSRYLSPAKTASSELQRP